MLLKTSSNVQKRISSFGWVCGENECGEFKIQNERGLKIVETEREACVMKCACVCANGNEWDNMNWNHMLE